MKYVVRFDNTAFHYGSQAEDYFRSIGVKVPQSFGGMWLVEMDGEQLVMLVLKHPKAEIYKPLKKE